YLMAGGNPNVVLCERGIRTFEPELRNTFDVAAIALVRELSHLPVIADPSHGTGRRDLVAPVSRAAIALGADGVMVEVHPCPERALSDGPQSLDFEGFRALMRSLSQPSRTVAGRSGCAPGSRVSQNAVAVPERARTLTKSRLRPAEPPPSIRQMTVFGTGLMGGSLALAARQRGLVGRVVGCDREQVLAHAQQRGAIDAGFTDPLRAAEGSQLIVLATPVGQILDLLERLGPKLPPETLLTDVGSTKAAIVRRAVDVFGKDAAHRFLPGHPMAGRPCGGIEQADGDLYRDAVWFLTPLAGQDLAQSPFVDFVRLLEGIGAKVASLDAERHDLLCAWTSHLPQLLSTVLASALAGFREDLAADSGGENDLDLAGGPALREAIRLASSPYGVWRDIVFTNTPNLEQAMLRLEQHLAFLRENLRTGSLREEFERANQFAAETRRRGL
ncbi:MAG: prephenate dehydrogenase/arogenate dehydrogenase family protein, partial [Terriglobales bacterium]